MISEMLFCLWCGNRWAITGTQTSNCRLPWRADHLTVSTELWWNMTAGCCWLSTSDKDPVLIMSIMFCLQNTKFVQDLCLSQSYLRRDAATLLTCISTWFRRREKPNQRAACHHVMTQQPELKAVKSFVIVVIGSPHSWMIKSLTFNTKSNNRMSLKLPPELGGDCLWIYSYRVSV